jgi:hypothetical protein
VKHEETQGFWQLSYISASDLNPPGLLRLLHQVWQVQPLG